MATKAIKFLELYYTMTQFLVYIYVDEIPGSLQRRKGLYLVKIHILSCTHEDIKVVMTTSVSANRKLPSQHCTCFF